MKPTQISAKDLGAINMPDFCPRCFWIKRNAKPLPFQIFPGIFSTIDSYSKKVIHASIDMFGNCDNISDAVSGVKKYHKVPHWSKFKRTDKETGIVVSGVVDDILEREDGLFIILDNKTAKFTENADKLRPIYDVQQNGYRWIFEGLDMGTVHSIPLLYWEPMTTVEDADFSIRVSATSPERGQFHMMFKVQSVQVKMDNDLIPRMLKKAKGILDLTKPPGVTAGCKDCESVAKLVDIIAGKT